LEVRLVGSEGEQLGIVTRNYALEEARKLGLDLVEVVAQAQPPVCRVMDYKKVIYDELKKKAAAKKKQKKTQVKEIKLRPGTDIGDYQVKLRNLIKFLESGDKVKITVRFRGREMSHQELGIDMMKRLEIDLAEYGVVEQYPKLEGRQMLMLLAPKKK
jgi:translation initiation factor IF-3